MWTSRALRATLIIAATALVAGSPPAATAAAAARPAPSWLFVQQADGGTLRKTGTKAYRLTLRGVAPSVTSFTDRPARSAGSETARRFVARWPGRGFAADPPNAALAMDGAARDRDLVVLTLSHPRYFPRTRTFTYAARPLKGTPSQALRGFSRRRDAVRELRFGAASLFIDDASNVTLTSLAFVVEGVTPGERVGIGIDNTGGANVAFSPAAGVTFQGGESNPWAKGPQPTPVIAPSITPQAITFSIDLGFVPGAETWPFYAYLATDPANTWFTVRNLSPHAFMYVVEPSDDHLPTLVDRTRGAEIFWPPGGWSG